MIRDLRWTGSYPYRTQPITGFVKDGDNIKVTTTEPHKRKTGSRAFGLDEFTVGAKMEKTQKETGISHRKSDDKSFFRDI